MIFRIFILFLGLYFYLLSQEVPNLQPPLVSSKSKEITKHADDKSKKPKKPKALPENSPPPSSNLSKPKGSE